MSKPKNVRPWCEKGIKGDYTLALGSRGGKEPGYEWAGWSTMIFNFFCGICSSVLSWRLSHLVFTTPCQGGIVRKYWEPSKVFFLRSLGLQADNAEFETRKLCLSLSSRILQPYCFPFRSLPLKSRITWGQSEDVAVIHRCYMWKSGGRCGFC